MDVDLLRLSTLVLAIFVGSMMFIVSRYIKIPAIVLLLITGVILGPEFMHVVDPNTLGNGLRQVISLSVAVILFEGGLTLHPRGMKETPHVIWKLLTIGVLVTWIATATAIYFIFDFSIQMSLLSSSLIIVTGPTVIAPLLKRINIKDKLYQILHWEGVLIDPIGVFVAILCFEWFSFGGELFDPLGAFSVRLLIGIVVGVLGGLLMELTLRKNIIPEDQINIFVFSSALFLFFISDYFVHESGILTVIIAGFLLGWRNPPRLRHIKQFKSELTELAIAFVFVLLAAKLDLNNFLKYGWDLVAIIVIVLFAIRPISIFFCSIGEKLNSRDRLFLSWIAPRGIIAGSIASLFALQLTALGYEEASFLETFTFSIIAATIVLQGLSASRIAKWLKVEEAKKDVWLIAGSNHFSIEIAKFIRKHTDYRSIFIDTNKDGLELARKNKFIAIEGNAILNDSVPEEYIHSIGHLLALTDNQELNQIICGNWSEIIEKKNLFRWSHEAEDVEEKIGGVGQAIWSGLNRPSQISFGFEQNECLFMEQLDDVNRPNSRQLMHIKNGELSFKEDTNGKAKKLFMVKLTRRISEISGVEHIFQMQPSTYKDLMQFLLDKVEEDFPKISHEKLSKKLIARELDYPTLLAHGVVVPHAHSETIDQAICYIAQVEECTDLSTHDGKPIQLVFMLISPKSDPGQHLRLLANIAKIASDWEQVKRLIDAKTADIMLAEISEIETI